MGGGEEKHPYVSDPWYSGDCILKKLAVGHARVFKGKELDLILYDVTS